MSHRFVRYIKIKKKAAFVIRTKDFCPWTKEEVEKYGFQVIGLK